MPWREVSVVDERLEFVALAGVEGSNLSALCARFGISRETGYKWLGRWRTGDEALEDRSRRPLRSPGRTSSELEARVLAVRDAHPAWGARKIVAVLEREGIAVPAPSTVHAVLQRHGRIVPAPGGAAPSRRFEMAAPNELWQMDFKGHIRLGCGRRCDPLTVVDDHSRYNLCLKACGDQTRDTVRRHLGETFERYGLPQAIFVDNGSPWGPSSREQRWTRLGVWLTRLGIKVLHSRPRHPQSRGKNERFHRTLLSEAIQGKALHDLDDAQRAFDCWRTVYNLQRPHQALGFEVPAQRYRPSPRPMPHRLPDMHYEPWEIIRKVPDTKPYVSFKGRLWNVPGAFQGEHLAIRPTSRDGRWNICFGANVVATIDFKP